MHENNPDASWLLPGSEKLGQSVDSWWSPVKKELIDGVQQREVRPVLTTYGRLVELFRADWFESGAKVDQVFCSVLHAGCLSAWHAHADTTDRIAVISGCIRLVLFDARAASPTRGLLNEFRVSEHRPALITVPPGIWHGVQNVGGVEAVITNAVDNAYRYEDPDHYCLPPDSDQIPFRFPALNSI